MRSGNPNPSPSTRFQKGVSGNPGGRPKSTPVTDALRRIFAQGLADRPLGDEPTKAEYVAARLFEDAVGRAARRDERGRITEPAIPLDFAKVMTLVARCEGKTPDRVIHEHDDDEPQRIVIPRRKRKRPGPADPGGHEAAGGG